MSGVDRLVGSYGPALEGSLGLLVPALAGNASYTSSVRPYTQVASGVIH
jgi:hypothetical protein